MARHSSACANATCWKEATGTKEGRGLCRGPMGGAAPAKNEQEWQQQRAGAQAEVEAEGDS